MDTFIGLDLGGTNIKAGVVDAKAQVIASLSVPTPGDGGPGGVIAAMIEAARDVAKKASVSLGAVTGVGIGSPGPIDIERGMVLAMPNLPGWDHVPVRDRIAEATGCAAVLENDANAAAFGEYWAGAGRDPSIRHLAMLTLGTGIGTGLIVDGQVIHGGFNVGGEGGHMIVDPHGPACGCGQRGCLESFASASHTARRAVEALDAGEPSTLQAVRAGGAQVTSKDVFEAARGGDALARRIAGQTAMYLAVGCVNLCRILDPQMIVFAGGMILAGDQLFAMVRQEFQKRTWKVAEDRVRIVPAQLGNDAGFIGAAGVAWKAHCR